MALRFLFSISSCAKYLTKQVDSEFDRQLDPKIRDLVWVDTVGWDDADLQGQIIFLKICKTIQLFDSQVNFFEDVVLRVKHFKIFFVLPLLRLLRQDHH